MTENKEKTASQSDIKEMQDAYEEALTKKEEVIQQLRKELTESGKSKAKAEGEIDDLKTAKEVAEARAERAEARYLRNQELESKGKQQEESLLKKFLKKIDKKNNKILYIIMTKNRIGSCSKCNSDLFNENKPFNTNYWALNNKTDSNTKFFCDNCWQTEEKKYFQDIVNATVEAECEHCQGVWMKGKSSGNYEATKNNHVIHTHDIGAINTGNYGCKDCENYINNPNRERERERETKIHHQNLLTVHPNLLI